MVATQSASQLYDYTTKRSMASISEGGMFRQSKNLKGSRGKGKVESVLPKPLPPPVSSEQVFRNKDMEMSTYSDVPSVNSANGAHSAKEEDHFGFLYSLSEKDFH